MNTDISTNTKHCSEIFSTKYFCLQIDIIHVSFALENAYITSYAEFCNHNKDYFVFLMLQLRSVDLAKNGVL